MEIESLFRTYLKADERILWVGQPKKGIQLRDADLILIPMSIILAGFTLILDYTLLHYESSLSFKMLGILFAAAAVYIGFVRFFTGAAKRARTFYCLTNRRIIIMKGRKHLIKTLPLKNIEQMDTTIEKDGSGFIIFGSTNPLFPWLLGGFYMSREVVPGLELLPDVKQVYELISEQIRINIPPDLSQEIKSENHHKLN